MIPRAFSFNDEIARLSEMFGWRYQIYFGVAQDLQWNGCYRTTGQGVWAYSATLDHAVRTVVGAREEL